MIIPGILEQDFAQIQNKIHSVENFAKVIHLDVADGELVDGKTYTEINTFASLKSKVPLQIHLMVKRPAEFLTQQIPNIESVIVHIESDMDFIQIKNITSTFGYKLGIALNPNTSFTKIEPYLEKVDYVQFMTVNPGMQGRPFVRQVPENILKFNERYESKTTQVDGNINFETINLLDGLEINNYVVGTAIVRSQDPEASYNELVKQVAE